MKATWNQSELIPQRVPPASDKPSKRDATLVMAAEKLAAKRHSLFTAFSGESETGSESVLGDCNHGRDSSKRNNKFDRQMPNVPNCKLTDAHELNPTICSRRSAQDVSPHTW